MDKDVLDMTLIERMVAAGMSRDCAAETAMWYMAQGDDEGLEDYVSESINHFKQLRLNIFMLCQL